MSLNSTGCTNKEKPETKSSQDESLNDKLEAISKSGAKNFPQGNRSFTTLLSKKPKQNIDAISNNDVVTDEISTNDFQELRTFNPEEDVLSEERLEKISTSSLVGLQKSSINNGHRSFSDLLPRTGASGAGQKIPVKSLIEDQKPTNQHMKNQEPFPEDKVSKHATSTDKNDRKDDIEKLVSEMATMSKIEKSLAAKMEKLHAIFSLENKKYGVDHQNSKEKESIDQKMVEAMQIEFNQLRGKLKTFERLLEEKLVVYQEDIVPWSKELMIKKTLETRNEPILQTQSHQAPNNQNIVSKKKNQKSLE